MVVDANGVLFLCKAAGVPGTWVQVSEQRQPTLQTLPTPERFIDTRSNLGGVQGPVPAGTTFTFRDDLTKRRERQRHAADPRQRHDPHRQPVGDRRRERTDRLVRHPLAERTTTDHSSISFGPGAIVANSYTVGLGPSTSGHRSINVFAQQQCDYIVDVVGYYG